MVSYTSSSLSIISYWSRIIHHTSYWKFDLSLFPIPLFSGRTRSIEAQSGLYNSSHWWYLPLLLSSRRRERTETGRDRQGLDRVRLGDNVPGSPNPSFILMKDLSLDLTLVEWFERYWCSSLLSSERENTGITLMIFPVLFSESTVGLSTFTERNVDWLGAHCSGLPSMARFQAYISRSRPSMTPIIVCQRWALFVKIQGWD